MAVATAKELIDLGNHAGVHPRIGATDVLPFVPVSGVTMDECVTLAHQAGERIWQELAIPVYFYERAALCPDRVRLEQVRGQGFEWLREEIKTNPDRAPDVGEPKMHETAGAVAVGARPFLIAFNINLRTNDLSIARAIAREVRGRDGGLPFVKALGFDLQSRGVSVTENLRDHLPFIIGDSHQLQQVFLNILNNAYDAVRDKTEGPRIEISTACKDDHVEVTFRDNGSGISQAERIFDPFFTTKRVGEGTGLGLSICYGIVKEHGGEILCSNNSDGEGATFSVRFPAVRELASISAIAGVTHT